MQLDISSPISLLRSWFVWVDTALKDPLYGNIHTVSCSRTWEFIRVIAGWSWIRICVGGYGTAAGPTDVDFDWLNSLSITNESEDPHQRLFRHFFFSLLLQWQYFLRLILLPLLLLVFLFFLISFFWFLYWFVVRRSQTRGPVISFSVKSYEAVVHSFDRWISPAA